MLCMKGGVLVSRGYCVIYGDDTFFHMGQLALPSAQAKGCVLVRRGYCVIHGTDYMWG